MKKLALDCIQEFERRNCQDRDAYVTASAPVTATGANAAGSPKQLRELFHLAVELERAALADDYFVSRKLFPNVGRGAESKRLLDGVAGRERNPRAQVDYYSGLALTAMGIPLTLFTCLFAVGRSAGWVAQWLEALSEPKRRISRPRQVYVGETRRPYPDVRARELNGRPNLKRSFTDSTQDEQDFGYFF